MTITITAMPRSQPSQVLRARSNLERRRQLDVAAQRVPDRTIFFMRQIDRALDDVIRHLAPDAEVKREGDEVARGLIAACAGDRRFETGQVVAAPGGDV